MSKDDIEDDYDFARSQYYNLADKGQEAIDLMLELARESEHPRAFEVLSNMLKQNAEIADKLMALQKQKKEVNKSDVQALPNGQQSLTQNNVFLGTSTDVQRMLHNKIKELEIDADNQ